MIDRQAAYNAAYEAGYTAALKEVHAARDGSLIAQANDVSPLEFQAMAQGKVDYTLPVIRIRVPQYGDLLTICTPEAAIYVTREQACKFWGLA